MNSGLTSSLTSAPLRVKPVVCSSRTTAVKLDPLGSFMVGPLPDRTIRGGNARGANAVDLQSSRTAATQVASGSAATAIGIRNTASGTNAFAAGTTNSASGGGAVAIGDSTTASGASSVTIGVSNTSSGVASFTLGNYCTASATGSHVYGNSCTASAAYSFALGFYAVANRYGMMSYASGWFAANGDAQKADFVLRCKTTTNSAVELALDGSTTYLTIPSGKVIALLINVTGVKSDGSAVAHYVRQYAVKNVAGTSSEVYAPITIGTDNAAGTSLSVTTVDAGDYVSIKPTGIAAETWRWTASVQAVEVAYGT